MNHPTATVSEPYSLLGEFFTLELDKKGKWLFDNILIIREQLDSGKLSKYDGGGEGHYLTITNNEVVVETMFEEPPRSCTIPSHEFWECVDKWMEFLKQGNHHLYQ